MIDEQNKWIIIIVAIEKRRLEKYGCPVGSLLPKQNRGKWDIPTRRESLLFAQLFPSDLLGRTKK